MWWRFVKKSTEVRRQLWNAIVDINDHNSRSISTIEGALAIIDNNIAWGSDIKLKNKEKSREREMKGKSYITREYRLYSVSSCKLQSFIYNVVFVLIEK